MREYRRLRIARHTVERWGFRPVFRSNLPWISSSMSPGESTRILSRVRLRRKVKIVSAGAAARRRRFSTPPFALNVRTHRLMEDLEGARCPFESALLILLHFCPRTVRRQMTIQRTSADQEVDGIRQCAAPAAEHAGERDDCS